MSKGDTYEVVQQSSVDRTIHFGFAEGDAKRPFSNAGDVILIFGYTPAARSAILQAGSALQNALLGGAVRVAA